MASNIQKTQTAVLKITGFKSYALWCVLSFFANCTWAATLNISDSPLTVTQAVPPMTMLVMSRDHKLFYEAYNDFSDLNGDGILDLTYNPSIDYYGYFDSYKCYRYDSANRYFYPYGTTSNKKCTSYSNSWSGDWLNWATMARIDTLRKALYGGKRVTPESTSVTILERTEIPQDAHSWGKEYQNLATNGYNINEYTPLSSPSANKRHLFGNTTLLNVSDNNGYLQGVPLFRVLQNQTVRVWDWASKERPVVGQSLSTGTTVTPTDYVLRVKVCDSAVGLENNCRLYPNGQYKPIGILQEFGDNNAMKFGLLTGSYEKNLSGGVLRKNIDTISSEINAANGTINTGQSGIIKTIDNLKITGFGGSYEHAGGWILNRPPNQGEFKPWGNPIAEMMYETLRYFAGKASPTPAYYTNTGIDVSLGLPASSWQNPYSANPYCSKPNMLIISDVNPSYDSDELPGSYFGSFSGDLSLNVQSLGQTVWNQEFNGSSTQHFIGQSGANSDGAPTPKTVTSFGNIRGLVPDEPNKQGSYYAASVAYYGLLNDINSAQDDQKLHSFVLALNSPLPQLKILVNGKIVTLIPFAKTVGGCSLNGTSVNSARGRFQPTNQIVDFYIESWTPTSGVFRVNYEDVEQGADHDMDAIARYAYTVNGNGTLTVNVSSDYAAGCLVQHMGYIISGTTQDGTYLEVRDNDTTAGSDIIYYLDTPPGQLPGARDNTTILPLTATRTFSPGTNLAATILNGPLFYAAKWGSFNDKNGNNVPDNYQEWDADQDGIPDNYFLVTNPAKLVQQLNLVLNNILKRSSSAASSSINSGSLNTQTRLYQVLFNSSDWTGSLLSFPIKMDGTIDVSGLGPNGSLWDASILLGQTSATQRKILTFKPSSKKGIAFRWPSNSNSPSASELDSSQIQFINTSPDTGLADGLGQRRLNFIRGEQSYELANGGSFRNRNKILGDIVQSAPMYVGPPNQPYFDQWSGNAPENGSSYSNFKVQYKNRDSMIYVGANDGMLHAFNADTGTEQFAYIPSVVYKNLHKLSSQTYAHNYYVDGSPNVMDAYFGNSWHTVLASGLNKGGQGVFALDVTSPTDVSEATANQNVLWEFSDLDDVDMGYSYSQPAIVRQANGEWVAIFGNGYNNNENDGRVSTTGNAVLYVVRLSDGALLQKLDTGRGVTQDPTNSGLPNGLATPAVVDLNGDFNADLIYAGDLQGNLWKLYWDSSTQNWRFATYGNAAPTPIFSARNAANTAQPITVRPVVRKTTSGLQIYFGTGKYIEGSDKVTANAPTQSFYSIIDNLNISDSSGRVSSRNVLLQQTIMSEQTFSANSTSYQVRITSNNSINGSHKGWYIDLLSPLNGNQGERQITSSVLRNNRIIFTTLIPDSDVCGFGGTGWLMELNAADGARLPYTPFDLNADKKFTTSDQVLINNQRLSVSGVQSQVGVIPSPSIINAGTVEYKYMPGSSGRIGVMTENPGSAGIGRQSWRELY